MTRLAKLCEWVPNTSKTARLLELLEISKEKVLVFSRFTATLEEIAQRLSEYGISFSMFQGNMSAEEKDRAVGNFQNGNNVMLCSEIGGEGRNLQFCSTMVNFDLPWNPMLVEQRIAAYGDEGLSHALKTLGFEFEEVGTSDLNAGALSDFDVLLE